MTNDIYITKEAECLCLFTVCNLRKEPGNIDSIYSFNDKKHGQVGFIDINKKPA
jgi:hypothetical protein